MSARPWAPGDAALIPVRLEAPNGRDVKVIATDTFGVWVPIIVPVSQLTTVADERERIAREIEALSTWDGYTDSPVAAGVIKASAARVARSRS